jgi:hypothetical protein
MFVTCNYFLTLAAIRSFGLEGARQQSTSSGLKARPCSGCLIGTTSERSPKRRCCSSQGEKQAHLPLMLTGAAPCQTNAEVELIYSCPPACSCRKLYKLSAKCMIRYWPSCGAGSAASRISNSRGSVRGIQSSTRCSRCARIYLCPPWARRPTHGARNIAVAPEERTAVSIPSSSVSRPCAASADSARRTPSRLTAITSNSDPCAETGDGSERRG